MTFTFHRCRRAFAIVLTALAVVSSACSSPTSELSRTTDVVGPPAEGTRGSEAEGELRRAFEEDPDAERVAVVSYVVVQPMKTSVDSLVEVGLGIHKLFHAEVVGDEVFTGSYPVEGDVDTAMEEYADAHHGMLRNSVDAQGELQPPGDARIAEAAEDLYEGMRERLRRFEADGMQLSGVRVSGPVRVLSEVARWDEVRAVELVGAEEQLSPLTPGMRR